MKNSTKIFVSILLIFNLVLSVFVYINYRKDAKRYKKYLKNEEILNKEIQNLQSEVLYLREKYNQTANYYNYQTEYSKDAYNYLAIGNSLTLITSLGRGISSTKPDNDYFNLLVKELKAKNKKVVAYPFNFVVWEKSQKRDEALSLVDVYLDEKLDLVTIQLGENVSDTTTFEADLEYLINYVKKKAQNAKIIVVGDFWDVKRNELRKNAAIKTNVSFVDLKDIIGKKEYQSKEGTTCYLKDGSTFKVTKEAESHPGDSGMKFIFDGIVQKIK